MTSSEDKPGGFPSLKVVHPADKECKADAPLDAPKPQLKFADHTIRNNNAEDIAHYQNELRDYDAKIKNSIKHYKAYLTRLENELNAQLKGNPLLIIKSTQVSDAIDALRAMFESDDIRNQKKRVLNDTLWEDLNDKLIALARAKHNYDCLKNYDYRATHTEIREQLSNISTPDYKTDPVTLIPQELDLYKRMQLITGQAL